MNTHVDFETAKLLEEKDIPEDNELKVASDGGYYSKPTSYVRITRPKITNNSIKVLKIL